MFFPVLFLSLLTACAPLVRGAGERAVTPQLFEDRVRMADGVELPLIRFFPGTKPKAVLLALHGFNDYRNAFADPSGFLKARGIAIYAYDQRGFGAAPNRGLWPGQETLVQDLQTAATLIRTAHPDTPFYLLGNSMGGAVILAAIAKAPLDADGVILVAPAVRARATMFVLRPVLLWIAAHTIPWVKLTGRDFNIRPSDNAEMLKRLGQDPWILKESRIDVLYGLVNLMDAAFAATPRIQGPALLLYGEKDELIPNDVFEAMLANLPAPRPRDVRVAIYEKGYHMLLRDLQAKTVLKDVAAWIVNPKATLPSGAETLASARCQGQARKDARFAATAALE